VYRDTYSIKRLPVLQAIHIKNFRCLREVSVPLKPLTVLLGKNDSGKTAFLEAIALLANPEMGFEPSDFWKWNEKKTILLEGKTRKGMITKKSGDQLRRTINLEDNETDSRWALAPARKFQLPMTGVEMECAGYTEEEERNLPIDADGGRIPALFDYFLRRDRDRFFAVLDALREAVPGLKDVQISTPEPHLRRLELVIDDNLRFHASFASVGVKIIIFFLALTYHPKPPKTILLEEPENGIHPKRLGDTMRLLHEITTGARSESPSQIILTTHSPFLLDFVDLQNDQVLVFRRNDDGSRSAEPVDAERLRTFLDEFMLGEIWFNEEEAGLVTKP
jgi:predicted ATPase